MILKKGNTTGKKAEGCNHDSFNQAQKNYRKFGAFELGVKKYVRKPNSREEEKRQKIYKFLQ